MHQPAKPATAVAGLLTLGLLVALAACGSSSSFSSSADASPAALFGTSLQQQCTAVADVLSDGPDPDADPVGYAEAQVLPLRQLHIADAPLRTAVAALASAYQAYSSTSGTAKTTAALHASKAEAAINAICPGAAN